jgi:hypothetical protein
MKVIDARNVHEALPMALSLLAQIGVERGSRNGPVVAASEPVTTVYKRPCERVVFWPERDANPFLHLYESLWILEGRRDVAPLTRYAKQFAHYSDDGEVFHAAYGYRWREQWGDQLAVIAQRLRDNPEDRRCVLQTWASDLDLGVESRDIPCNVMLTLQRSAAGALDVTVFQRSADIVWGTYGANAVQMSMLQEYMAGWIGCPVGTLTQVSVNWHAYVDVFRRVERLAAECQPVVYSVSRPIANPYREGLVSAVPLLDGCSGIQEFDRQVSRLLCEADAGFPNYWAPYARGAFVDMARRVLLAHHYFSTLASPERYDVARSALGDSRVDWVVAARDWVDRRAASWHAKMERAK